MGSMPPAAPPSDTASPPALALSTVESPFVTDPAEVAALDIPVEYVRRMEDAQRVYGDHHLQYRAYAQAREHGLMTVGFQCCWLGVGAWVVSRGVRYSDPMNSLLARWVESRSIRRFTTPISCLGLTIFVATCMQLPYDVRLTTSASRGLKNEEKCMREAMLQRNAVYREGKEAAEVLKAKEIESLNKLLK